MTTNLLDRPMSRREFSAATISALFVGMAVTLIDCGKSGGAYASAGTAPTPVPSGTTPAPAPVGGTAAPTGDAAGVVSDNHGHAAVVTSAQLTAAGAVALNIKGSADHNHVVTLSAAQVSQVAGGAKVTTVSAVTSDADPYYGTIYGEHTHVVVFN